MSKIKNVLFVCLGNTARSPAAEYLARYYTKKLDVNLEVDSCGFFNAFSYMQPESRKYLDSKGIKHSDFIPKVINRKLLEKQDLILTMESTHSLDIKRDFNNIRDIEKKTFTLREFNGEAQNIDIIDPYYTSDETYRKIMKIIDNQVKQALKKIIQINNSI
ncbi:Protein-arginine-phosphatase [subsurface metagenome]